MSPQREVSPVLDGSLPLPDGIFCRSRRKRPADHDSLSFRPPCEENVRGRAMRIVKVEDFHVDGGWRTFSFLKVTTDTGVTGWSEFCQTGWAPGLTGVIRTIGQQCVGEDPRAFRVLIAKLSAITRMVAGGTMQQALGAIENACVEICAKSLGIPVYALFGGKFRDHIPLYWSHFGTVRAAAPDHFANFEGSRALRTLDDLTAFAADAAAKGWTALKTNALIFSPDGEPHWWSTGLSARSLIWGGHCDQRTIDAIARQMEALRAGFGPGGDIMLDLSFGMAPESLIRLDEAVESSRLGWLEMDMHEPDVLADVRRKISTPVASLEAVYGQRAFRPFFERFSVDVAIVDILWNGIAESLRIAAMAETFQVNVAPHNFYGPLANMISAHFSAAVPNFRIMEFEQDDVPWKNELIVEDVVVDAGTLILPDRPGWGVTVNEDALARYRKEMP
ncbi:mandelate racemase/muconate lactonizing enzyme family protein [Rhizorhabdus dicambivorans]|uniref:Enolase n=1 Tax=Rhizorhabdus dicambivorans TaxID=1850238 RepID=A0A2A4FWI3_9SPHN|nr:mandelate racemase/muconate lactonizing enzyme family protein [Rhizorhabdus dicambivorans]ATE64165.1 enolase [Rhizorhabdus dicambivorans]PCE42563.1 enolase [Rhizorhabdus dicambivorans]